MNLFFLFFLIILSFQDFKNLQVDLYLIILLCFSIFFNYYKESLILSLISLILFYSINNKTNIADVIVLICTCSQFKIEYCGIVIIISNLISLLCLILFKKKEIAFIPCVLFAFFITKTLVNFI